MVLIRLAEGHIRTICCKFTALRRDFQRIKEIFLFIMHPKDSNKKCNGLFPHSSPGEGRAPRGPGKPPLSAPTSREISLDSACNTKKETEVSLRLSNFVLQK